MSLLTAPLFCKLVALILGKSCVKDLRVNKIVKQVMFKGVWRRLICQELFAETINKIFETIFGFNGKKTLTFKLFSSTECNTYIPCFLLIITLCFTCGERKIWSNIKKSRNIMTMIEHADVWCVYKHLSREFWKFDIFLHVQFLS